MNTVRAAGTLDLTVHLRDPAVEPKMRPASGVNARYRAITDTPENGAAVPQLAVREWEGHAGATICGRKLRLEELWVEHTPEAQDRFCVRCFDPDDDVDEDEPVPERRVEVVHVAGGVL